MDFIVDTTLNKSKKSFKKKHNSPRARRSKSKQGYRHQSNGYKDMSEKLERISNIFTEKINYIDHKANKERSNIRIRRKTSEDFNKFNKTVNVGFNRTESNEVRKNSPDFYKTTYTGLGKNNNTEIYQEVSNKDFNLTNATTSNLNRDSYLNFRPANEIKMLFVKSGETKHRKKNTFNIPHSKFSQTFKNSDDLTNYNKHLGDYGDH